MNKNKIRIGVLIVIFLLSIGTFFIYQNKQGHNQNNASNDKSKLDIQSLQKDTFSKKMPPIKENKFYIIYIKRKNGSGSSFVPEKLNPDFKNDSEYNVSISFDDDGNIINDDKIIQIDNFVISSQNKEKIREIAGERNYVAALKEIEERIQEIKESSN
ncbi:hypothetical protein ACFFIS_10510 [Virgibacillus soli]|uniref:hypothetical protein n=1 Tax=Paracerasibacillus soli TaxID=480284 RepID=UPI0035F0CC32